MVKRLLISISIMSLAVFSMGAGAMAWFSTAPYSGDVTIATGSPELEIVVDVDCDATPDATLNDGNTSLATPLSWSGIVPGDTTTDCFTVTNIGDGDLDVYIANGNWTGNNDLRNAMRFDYQSNAAADLNDVAPNNSALTSGRGLNIGSLAEGASLTLTVNAELPETGGNQNALKDTSFSFTSTITGYTN